MLKHYLNRSLMLLGAAAVAASASAADVYRDVTGQYITNPAYIPGWQGALTSSADGVAETYDGAFNLYQTLPDMPEGEYTLKVDAFYRCGTNDFSKEHMVNGANHYAYIYINGEKKVVKGLFDGRDAAPNGTGEAATAFAAGEYTNEVKVNHPGGDMVVGIMNEGGYPDEWCCFDNFRLYKGSEDMTSKIKNADFSEGLDVVKDDHIGGWDIISSEGKKKAVDVKKGGGVYRKTNASPYNIGQQVELPAGKYRFSVVSFHRYGGAGNLNGKYVTCKGTWDLSSGKSPKDWFDAGNYETNEEYYDHAYIYMSKNEDKPALMSFMEGGLTEDVDKRTRIRDCWEINEGDYANMPDNETRPDANGIEIVPPYETRNVVPGWAESGNEREAAAAFVANPDKYRHYVKFELAAPAKVWLGIAKDSNTGDQYWNPWTDIKLEKLDETAGVAGIVVEDENAPVEYYNLQGVRVANPENGLYIVKQGKKVSKKFIR